ncbi:MAG TPA: beta-ketoacyl synthase N-terminal-like domain-containing protein, partial [Gemmatimonadaceae bacterium]
MASYGSNGRRVAVMTGLRTPFAKAGTELKSLTVQDLGRAVVAELIERSNLDGKEIDTLVFGTVIPSVLAPNLAREVALLPMLPKGIPAYTVSRACASANQAITDAADQIVLGNADVAIAGGAESLSNVPILHSRAFSDVLVSASRAKTLGARLGKFSRVRPRDLVPITPAIAEPSTGETMGQSAEKMAKLNHIPREEQDQFALRSHRLAAAGTQDGRLASEMMPFYVPPAYDTVLTHD